MPTHKHDCHSGTRALYCQYKAVEPTVQGRRTDSTRPPNRQYKAAEPASYHRTILSVAVGRHANPNAGLPQLACVLHLISDSRYIKADTAVTSAARQALQYFKKSINVL
ncbi:hypothetical protein [Xylanibacter rodentium]|uniref:Uncharacterized protein n=1 Tax=Xylanibacter rodentium TaxID=2736289 RepID=A0ABX2AZ28_9BACT|nr:hypothetical protein [Xylanibacter rodentium]NPE14930.1 hypothetical protein [Xylanibacter rodentium]NPE39487.1 hypothetical protein [Prevotella sp. PCJ2]